MARGFGGETSEQEARGNENISESQVSSGRGDAISRGMGFGGNDGSNDEDVDQSFQQDKAAMANLGAVNRGYAMGNPNYNFGQNYNPITNSYSQRMGMNQFMNIANTPAANLAGARSTLGRLQGVLGSGNPISKNLYNGIMGITSTNPYGHQNAFSRILGIDPKNIDYVTGPGGIGYSNAAKIAQQKYNRYSDFANQSAQAQKQAFGSLFGNPVGELTAAGPVAQQVDLENIPLGDALAVQAATFGLGPFGYGLMEMADPFSTYVPTGSKAYNEQFDPAINKDLPTSVMGQASSRTGLGISSLVDSVKDYFSPSTPAPTPIQIDSVTPSRYETRADIIARTSQHPLTGETSIPSMVSAPSSSLNAPPQYDVKVPSSLSGKSLPEKRATIEEMIKNNYGAIPAELQTNPVAPGYSSGVTGSFDGNISFWGPSAAEQEARQRQKELFNAPTPLEERKMRAQEFQKQLKDLIEGPTAGITGVTQLAAGPNLYQGRYQGETGLFSPGGKGQQYYGGQAEKGFFDRFGTGVGEALDNAYGYVSRLVS